MSFQSSVGPFLLNESVDPLSKSFLITSELNSSSWQVGRSVGMFLHFQLCVAKPYKNVNIVVKSSLLTGFLKFVPS